MRKLAVVIGAALMGLGSLPTGARAGDGGAVAAGVIGGLAFGTLAGAAIAESQRAPAYVDEGYAPPPRRRTYYYYGGSPPPYGDFAGHSYERTYYDPWSGQYYSESWHD